jgi:hypothetical protein
MLLVNNNTSNVAAATSSPLNNGTNSQLSRIFNSSTAFTAGETGSFVGTLDLAALGSIAGKATLVNALVNICVLGVDTNSNAGNKLWIKSIRIEYVE